MIKLFKHKVLEYFFYDGTKKGIQAQYAYKIADILDLLDVAGRIQVMNFPGSRLHKLHPKKDEIWSARVSGNWRMTFKFIDGDAWHVDYLDYH